MAECKKGNLPTARTKVSIVADAQGFRLLLHGRLFPFDLSDPLVALAAVADIGAGLPWLIARMLDAGAGKVTAVTFEYGNTFTIVAGLLNFLVVLDAFDIAVGRK